MEALEEKLPDYCKKLGKRGVTTLTLHEDYLRCYRHLSKAVMRIEHKAGDKMYVDYLATSCI